MNDKNIADKKMSDKNILSLALKKCIFDLLTMSRGQFIILLLGLCWCCFGYSFDYWSGTVFIWIFYVFGGLQVEIFSSIQDLPMEVEDFWKLQLLSEWIRQYLLAVFLSLPIIIRAVLTGQASAICNNVAFLLGLVFLTRRFIRSTKYSMNLFDFVFPLCYIILLGLAAWVDADAALWVLILVIILTLLNGLVRYFCFRKADPYLFFEIRELH